MFFDEIKKAFSQISTICINYNDQKTNVILGKKTDIIYGNGTVTDTLCTKKFVVSPQSFYQVNHDGCELLYSIAKDYVKDSKRVLDLYCGIGTVGICTADKTAHLVGVEIVPEAIKNAKVNAKLNGICDCEFYALDAADVKTVAGGEFDAIIVDPPRKGCDKKTLDFIIEQNPKKLVYISCDSATLARDLAVLKEHFEIESVTPVDMFPRTHHCEAAALMHKKTL